MAEVAYKIVLVRHGESEWNLENKFCGWHDADLSPKGVQEAVQAGKVWFHLIIFHALCWFERSCFFVCFFWDLKQANLTFDVAYTSVLKRAIKTLYYVQEELDLHWIPVHKTWRLNERMYGGLQGLNKSETAAKYGEQQVKVWIGKRLYLCAYSGDQILRDYTSLRNLAPSFAIFRHLS